MTPAIDRLARDGIRFANAYAHVPLTLPSHSSLLTGRLPYEHGVRSNIGFKLDGERFPTLATLLSRSGYRTGAAVSSYVLRSETGIAAGFERFDDALEVRQDQPLGGLQRPGGEALAADLGWLAEVGARPFFLWLHLFEPHTPYSPPEPFRTRAPTLYDGEIEAADAIVGRLLAELERRGLYQRALVVLASDHGEGLADHGEQEHGILLYREALHVPLVLKLPGNQRAGEISIDPVGLIDIVPTVLAVVGLTPPPGLPGTNLLAASAAHRRLYAETFYPRIHLGWSALRSLIDERYQLIDGPDPELYDLIADAAERDNLRDRERRAFQERRQEIALVPEALTEATPASPEERKRLAALGYLTGTESATTGPRPDPKGRIGELAELQRNFERVQAGRVAEALASLRRLVQDNPDMVDARVQLAAVLRRLGHFESALEQYREVVRQAPGHLQTVAVEIAKVELDLGDLAAAEENARLALSGSPAEAHLLLAQVAARRRNFVRAEAEARAAIGNPALPRLPALVLLAEIAGQTGRPSEGLDWIEQAESRVASGAAEPIATLDSTRGDLLARLGRTSEAESAFRREIERFPRTEEAYVRLAILLAAGHRFDEIQPTLDALVAAVPTRAGFELAARTMEDLGNRAAASAYRRRAPAAAGGGR